MRQKTMKRLLVIILIMSVSVLCGCGQTTDTEPTTEETPGITQSTDNNPEGEISMSIDDTDVTVVWEDNESVTALKEFIADKPLVIDASAYGGFEQVGSLGTTLPSDDEQIQTKAGDIMLYSSDQIVVFFGTNSWSYTPLGRITDKSDQELEDLLKGDNVKIKLEME